MMDPIVSGICSRCGKTIKKSQHHHICILRSKQGPSVRERVKCEGCGVWHFPEDPCPTHVGDLLATPFVDPEALRFASMCYATGPDMSVETITRNIVETYLRCTAHPEDAPEGPWIDFDDLKPHPDGMTIGVTASVIGGLFTGQRGKVVDVDYGTRKARFELDLNHLKGDEKEKEILAELKKAKERDSKLPKHK